MEPQVSKLFLPKLEHEVRRETGKIAPHSSIETFRLNAVKFSEVRIEHHLLPTNEQYSVLDALRRNIQV